MKSYEYKGTCECGNVVYGHTPGITKPSIPYLIRRCLCGATVKLVPNGKTGPVVFRERAREGID